MAMHRVLYQEWESSDSWSGPEKAGSTVHLNQADRDAYVQASFEKTRRPDGRTPDFYLRTAAAPRWIEVDDETYNALVAGAPGIHVQETKLYRPI